MEPSGFRADIELRPDTYRALAEHLEAKAFDLARPAGPLLLVGMGSSRYAAGVAARYLQAAGIPAVADYASAEVGPRPDPNLTVLAISAGGGSAETTAAVDRYLGRSRVVAVTNRPDTEFAQRADYVIALHAGEEHGGVACRSYSHTLAVLLHLASHWGIPDLDVPARLRRAADSVSTLLATAPQWLPPIATALSGLNGTWVLAPADRLSSAQQSALMLREGPRRASVGCETGDWSHVDVYLTKTLDYRALLLRGSRWDEAALGWLRQRGSTWVSVGADDPTAAEVLRYAGDDDPIVALLTETVVAELVSHRWWNGD